MQLTTHTDTHARTHARTRKSFPGVESKSLGPTASGELAAHPCGLAVCSGKAAFLGPGLSLAYGSLGPAP